jgi:hypothetical protein
MLTVRVCVRVRVRVRVRVHVFGGGVGGVSACGRALALLEAGAHCPRIRPPPPEHNQLTSVGQAAGATVSVAGLCEESCFEVPSAIVVRWGVVGLLFPICTLGPPAPLCFHHPDRCSRSR